MWQTLNTYTVQTVQDKAMPFHGHLCNWRKLRDTNSV